MNDGDVVADEADAEGAVDVSVDGAAASDDAGSDTAGSDDETPADETPADGTATDADAAQVAPGPVSAAGLPSFDDILFGNGDAADEEATSFPGAEAPAHAVDGEAAGVPIGEEAGVEVFDDLGPTDGASDASSDGSSDSDEAAADEDADPRSAAVSSMLADAARAYFEDEPKDYPLGEAPSESDGSETDDAAPSEPEADPATDETPSDEASDREASDRETSDDEASDGEASDGEAFDDAPADGAPRTTVIEIIPEIPLTATDDELANADHYDQSGDGDQHHEHGEYRPRD